MEKSFDDELISDLYKDANGCRPGSSYMKYWSELSDTNKEIEWNYFITKLDTDAVLEKELVSTIHAAFEMQLERIIAVGAGSREVALRWITSTEDFQSDQCLENWIFRQGFLFSVAGEKLLLELKHIYGVL